MHQYHLFKTVLFIDRNGFCVRRGVTLKKYVLEIKLFASNLKKTVVTNLRAHVIKLKTQKTKSYDTYVFPKYIELINYSVLSKK